MTTWTHKALVQLTQIARSRLAAVVTSRVVVAASGTLIVLLTSAVLSPRARGDFADMQAATLIVGSIGSASIWLGISVKTSQDADTARQASSLALLWAIPLALPALVIAVTAVPPTHGSAAPSAAVVFTSLAISTYLILQGIPLGLGRMRDFARVEIWRAILTFTLVAATLVAIEAPPVLIVMQGLAYSLGSVTLLARVRRALPFRRPHWRGFLRPVLQTSLRAHPANVLGLAVYRLDIMVMALIAPAQQVAFYSLAVAFSEGVWLAPGAIGITNVSDISNLAPEAARRVTRRRIPLAVGTAGATALAIGAAATVLIDVALPPAYRQSIGPLWISLAGTVAFSLSHAISPYVIIALRRTELMTVTSGLTLVLNIGLLVLLVPAVGVAGASLASSIAYGFAAAATTLYYTTLK